MTNSNRIKITGIALALVVIYEVAKQFGVEISPETIGMAEAILVALGWSDGQRRLGEGHEKEV